MRMITRTHPTNSQTLRRGSIHIGMFGKSYGWALHRLLSKAELTTHFSVELALLRRRPLNNMRK
jgi:hypothetical protein